MFSMLSLSHGAQKPEFGVKTVNQGIGDSGASAQWIWLPVQINSLVDLEVEK